MQIASVETFQTCDEDTDVVMEREKVREMKNSDALIIVRNLEKWFGKLNAVKKINFHVSKGECFGLLGICNFISFYHFFMLNIGLEKNWQLLIVELILVPELMILII